MGESMSDIFFRYAGSIYFNPLIKFEHSNCQNSACAWSMNPTVIILSLVFVQSKDFDGWEATNIVWTSEGLMLIHINSTNFDDALKSREKYRETHLKSLSF